MLEDLHVWPSHPDAGFVALQGRLDRGPVNVRVQRTAIEDLDRFSGGRPTGEQRAAFVRHNRDAIREIAQAKIDQGDTYAEDWFGRDALAVTIDGADFEEYLREGHQLSYAAFDPRVQPGWGRDGRF
jgi:hypothetical protein